MTAQEETTFGGPMALSPHVPRERRRETSHLASHVPAAAALDSANEIKDLIDKM